MSDSLFLNPYEQLSALAGNIATANAGGAFRSVFKQETLSPEERKSLVKRYIGDDTGPLSSILEVVTHPLVIAGAVLSLKYPIASAENLLAFGTRAQQLAKKAAPGMRFLSTFDDIFGREIGNWMDEVVIRKHRFNTESVRNIEKAVLDFEKGGGKFDRTTLVRVGAWMDGLHKPTHSTWKALADVSPAFKNKRVLIGPLNLSAQEQALAERLRGELARVYGTTKEQVGSNQIVAGLNRLGISGKGPDVEDYFPRIQKLSREQIQERYRGFLDDTRGLNSFQELKATAPERQVSRSFAARSGRLLPDPTDLKRAGLWTDDLERAYGILGLRAAESGTELGYYGLNAIKSSTQYVHSMANTFAWETPLARFEGVGERISPRAYLKRILPQVNAADKTGLKAAMLKETYIPALSGQMTWEQSVDSMAFSSLKEWAAKTIDAIPGVPQDLKRRISEPLLMSQDITAQSISRDVAGFLYGTTLGFNVVSPVKNLLQNLITTVPTIGVKDTLAGMRQTLKGFSGYLDDIRGGLTSEAAFTKRFPEFAEFNLDIETPHKLLDVGAIGEGASGIAGKGRRAWDSFTKKALTLFTGSERFNRLTAFYGTRNKALRELPGKEVMNPLTGQMVKYGKGAPELQSIANLMANDVTRMTQFGGGPLNAPYGLLRGPFRNPLVRQYQQFPLRVLHFGLGPATTLGGEGGRNFGTLGRMALASGATYGIGKEVFNTDLSDALALGAMPELGDPTNDPFGVFPFVSPGMQLAGNTLKSIATGDASELRMNLPLLLPGGVQAARMSTAVSPRIAEWFGRPFADYQSKTPDGRVPVFTKKGTLQGYYTPQQLWARAVGIGNPQGAQEVAMARFLLGNRERIREARRNYTEAIVQGDYTKANALNENFKRAYPGMGGIQIKKSDIKAYQDRRTIPRLERVVETLPVELRPLYSQILSLSMGSQAVQFLGVDPELFSQPRSTRNAARTPTTSGVYGLPPRLQQPVQGIRQRGIQNL